MNSHPVMYKTSDLRPDVLDKVWQDWNCRLSESNQKFRYKHIYETHYTHVIRSSQKAKAFEDWLYEEGAYVVQKNQKRFIRFHENERAVMFALRWG